MRALIDLVPLLLLAAVVVLIVQRSRLTARERTELANLRMYKDETRDAALTELEIDSSNPLARIVLDHVHQVDAANNNPRKELT